MFNKNIYQEIGYKFCSFFADVYETISIRKTVIDHRLTPAEEHTEHLAQEHFKNGIPAPENTIPKERIAIFFTHASPPSVTWDAIHVEERIEEKQRAIEVIFNIRNIFASVAAVFILEKYNYI